MIEIPQSSQFKVQVVAGDGSGRLLGACPSIKPALPLRSLLPVREADDDELGGEIWRVDFGDDELPELLVNREISGISEIVRTNKDFRALVMPAVLRAILTRLLIDARADPEDEERRLGRVGSSWQRALHPDPNAAVPRLPHDGDDSAHDAARSWIRRRGRRLRP